MTERVWVNIGEGVRSPALVQLLRRMTAADPELEVALTVSRGVRAPVDLPDRVRALARPLDLRQMTERFVRDWSPRAALFTGTDLLPSAVPVCRDAGVGLIFMASRWNNRSGMLNRLADFRVRSRLRLFDKVFAADRRDAAQFRRMGVEPRRVEILGPIEEGAPALPCNEAERDTLAGMLAGRPVWVAAGVLPEELSMLDRAHRAASRGSHRLLMIAVPEDAKDGARMRDWFSERNWRTGLRSDGDEPDPEVQVYVADTDGESGLWFRLAPITLIGSSLAPPGGGQNPYAPVALGSAVIHGPYIHRFEAEAARLLDADASRRVEDAEGLGEAVSALLSPDRAALQAHRAWEITSEGAAASDRLIEVVRSFIDRDAA